MMLFSRLLGKQSIQIQPTKWEFPERSLGAPVGPLRGGRYQCWEVAGKAREIFTQLSTEIKEYLEASTISSCDIISWSMYMIGRTPETAAPKVLICSINSKVRKAIRKSIEYSGIMSRYPGIGLGDTSTLPDRHVIRLLSGETIKTLLVLRKCEPELAVLVEGTDPHFQPDPASGKKINKRRAFVVDPADYSLRPITLGPVITVGEKQYLLTAAHAFSTNKNQSESQSQYEGTFDDCDFDGMSDGENEADVNQLEKERSSSLAAQLFARMNPFSNSEPSRVQANRSTEDHVKLDQESYDVDVLRLRFYGKMALSSATGNRPSLDYALIEEKGIDNPAAYRNQDLEPPPIRVNGIETIGSRDASIVAYLGDSGEVHGDLTGTPTYLYIPGSHFFQEVYPIRLHNHQFYEGDSGAGVFGFDGRFFGHVVAGGPGTNIAYIVPALYTMANIDDRLNGKSLPVTLNNLKQMFWDIVYFLSTSKVASMTLICFVTINLLARYLGLFDANKGWAWSLLGSVIFHLTSTLPLFLAVAAAYTAGRIEIFPPRVAVALKVLTLWGPPILLVRYSNLFHEIDDEERSRVYSLRFHFWSILLTAVAVILVFMGGQCYGIIKRRPRRVQGKWARIAKMTKT